MAGPTAFTSAASTGMAMKACATRSSGERARQRASATIAAAMVARAATSNAGEGTQATVNSARAARNASRSRSTGDGAQAGAPFVFTRDRLSVQLQLLRDRARDGRLHQRGSEPASEVLDQTPVSVLVITRGVGVAA